MRQIAPHPERTSADIRAAFDRMPVKLNIFRTLAHAERCGWALPGIRGFHARHSGAGLRRFFWQRGERRATPACFLPFFRAGLQKHGWRRPADCA